MPPNQQTYFNSDWLNKPEFKHIKEAKSNTDAYCTLCKKTFKLSNMGARALTSHVNGDKHKKRIEIEESTPDIRIFSAERAVRSRSVGGKDPDDPPEALAQQNAGGVSAASTSGSTVPATPASASDSCDMQRRLDRYLKKDDVTIAEILWCLQSVENHTSASATGKQSVLFPRMFPDSKIAASMSLGRTKTGYGLVYGLAPYFKNKLLGSLRESGAFVVAFDESLNKVSQKQQMDLAVRYWDIASDEVQSHYYSSAFLGRARAVDLLDAFKSELSELNLDNLEQISMDGPNVNWSFLKEFEADRRMCTGSSSPMFINMGSCGLHVVNNSFKTGAQATGWNVVPFLRSIYWVFKDSPTRRSNYIAFNKPDTAPLPKKFCSVRWLENEEVADRAVKAIPHLKNFVKGNSEEKIKITSKSYKTMQTALADKLLPAKIAFFSFVSSQVTPFLRKYQCEKPMSPFLYSDLTAFVRDLMSLFIKEDVLKQSKSVCDIELKNENYLSSSKVVVGHAVRAELKKASVSSESLKGFKDDCLTFLSSMCKLLLKKSPLSYAICKSITFCDPNLIYSHPSVCNSRLTSALNAFADRNRISSKDCDKVSKEFRILTNDKNVISLCKEYDKKHQRVDHFWRDLLKDKEECLTLYKFLREVLILSHGQAFVERGFSINKEIIVENQLDESLVAQRLVYDGVKSEGGVSSITVDKSMILSFRNARDRYGSALEKRREGEREEVERLKSKRATADRMSELKAKKAKLMTRNAAEMSAIDDEMNALRSQL